MEQRGESREKRRNGSSRSLLIDNVISRDEIALTRGAQWTQDALWSKTAKNTDCSTGPIAPPFARLLAPLTCSLARSLRSLPRLWDSESLMSQNDLVLSHSAMDPGCNNQTKA